MPLVYRVMRALALLTFVAPALLSAACVADMVNQESCTLLACSEGVRIDFTETKAGTYAFEVIVDGTTTTCSATLPLPANETGSACSSDDVILMRTGAALDASNQSIGGIVIGQRDAKSITLRATRDGQPIHDETFAPSYVVSPGPNGPECEPKECKQATHTLR